MGKQEADTYFAFATFLKVIGLSPESVPSHVDVELQFADPQPAEVQLLLRISQNEHPTYTMSLIDLPNATHEIWPDTLRRLKAYLQTYILDMSGRSSTIGSRILGLADVLDAILLPSPETLDDPPALPASFISNPASSGQDEDSWDRVHRCL